MTDELLDVLRDELNIKRVQFLQGSRRPRDAAGAAELPQLGGASAAARRRRRSGSVKLGGGAACVPWRRAVVTIDVGGAAHELEPGDLDVIEERRGAGGGNG
jgi:hypothetical protein